MAQMQKGSLQTNPFFLFPSGATEQVAMAGNVICLSVQCSETNQGFHYMLNISLFKHAQAASTSPFL